MKNGEIKLAGLITAKLLNLTFQLAVLSRNNSFLAIFLLKRFEERS